MGSTFSGLEIAKRGLTAHQQALNTTGHNISNADNKNFARQRVNMESFSPLYTPSLNRGQGAGMMGQGTSIRDIERVRNEFVDRKINMSQQNQSYWQARETYLHRVEVIVNEPADESLRSQLGKLWQSWQGVAEHPDKLAHREVLTARAKNLTFVMRDNFQRLFDLRKQADNEIVANVSRINDITSQLASLNDRIMKSVAVGDNPNDLRDQRDAMIQNLASIADISIEKIDPNETIVYLGGEMLVQGPKLQLLKAQEDPRNEGLHHISWAHNNQKALFRSSKMQALLEVRDNILKDHIEKLDLLAINLTDITNEIHRDGFALTKETNLNFFDINNLSRNVRGNYDLNGDGTNDVTAVFKVAGRNSLKADRPLGISGTLTLAKNDEKSTAVYINYRPDETLNSVVKRINRSDAGVVAYLNHNDNLVLKARRAEDNWQSNFMIRHIEDSGELMVGYAGLLQNSGSAGAFEFRRIDETTKLQSNLERITLTPKLHPASSMRVADSIIRNPALIAASNGEDIGGTGDVNQSFGSKDGQNALRIAQGIKHKKTMVGKAENIDQFYNSLVSKMGIEARTAKDQVANSKLVMTNLENMRQSVMGVNLDEEMANMVQFQHGYNAAARIINVMNEMLNRIIDKLG